MCEICSKSTINTPERRHRAVFIVNFAQVLHIVLMFLLLTLNKKMSVAIVSRTLFTFIPTQYPKHEPVHFIKVKYFRYRRKYFRDILSAPYILKLCHIIAVNIL